MTPFYQPSRQAFSSSQNMQQPSFGGGFGGGFQMPQQNFGGFGGGYGFQQPQYGGFGGGYGGGYGGGFGFQQPQYGGFGGGFQPQYGGFGGGFQQQGFGFNPMLGGIGGLGFNPMMGPQFGMPMQGFNPYQQRPYNPDRADESGMPMPGPTGRETFDNPRMMDMRYRGGPQMSPEMQQQPQVLGPDGRVNSAQLLGDLPSVGFGSRQPMYGGLEKQQELDPNLKNFSGDAQTAYWAARTPPPNYAQSGGWGGPQRQPMYGGLGSLGFNTMMGPQFGMPMQRPFNPADDSGMGAENARSARENMRNMSPAQMQNLQSLMQQLQSYGINSPQGQAMLG